MKFRFFMALGALVLIFSSAIAQESQNQGRLERSLQTTSKIKNLQVKLGQAEQRFNTIGDGVTTMRYFQTGMPTLQHGFQVHLKEDTAIHQNIQKSLLQLQSIAKESPAAETPESAVMNDLTIQKSLQEAMNKQISLATSKSIHPKLLSNHQKTLQSFQDTNQILNKRFEADVAALIHQNHAIHTTAQPRETARPLEIHH